MSKMTIVLGLVLAGCGGGGPKENCTQASCGSGLVYQACVTPGTTHARYLLGTQSCSCDDSGGCDSCATQLAAYCAGSITNGTNGSGSNGTSGSGNNGTNGSGNNGTNGGLTSSTGSTNGNGGSCTPGGQSCQSFSQCCSGTCANQICTSCSATGQSCAGGSACCGGLTCYMDVCGSCKLDGSSCTLASDCCSNICHLGSCQACTALAGSCTTSAECCNGASCTNGVCGGADATCLALPAGNCQSCCQSNHVSGHTFINNLAVACLCQANTCQSTCLPTVCASPSPTNPDQACINCFNSACQTQVDASCQKNADCAAYDSCYNACPQ
jgi:hypothetical protein